MVPVELLVRTHFYYLLLNRALGYEPGGREFEPRPTQSADRRAANEVSERPLDV